MDMLEIADQLETLPAAGPDGDASRAAISAPAAAPDPRVQVLHAVSSAVIPAAHEAYDAVRSTMGAAGIPAVHELAGSPSVQAPTVESNLFGTFFLARTEFALPVEAIREVVVFPERVTVIPLSPAFLTGVFNLRGTIIPIIDLRAILGMSDAVVRETQKIAIVDFSGTRVGLIFDATGEMLRVQPGERHPFHYADDDPSHVAHRAARHVVKGALKLSQGERIVQILDPAELMMIEQVPQILDKQRAGGSARRLALTQRRQCVSFRLGDAALAFEIGAIHEIIRVPEIQESVLKREICLGMFNLRGDVMPLVDFGALLGMTRRVEASVATDTDDERRIVVMRLGEDSVGLLVDSVDSIVGYTAEQLLPIPSIGARRGASFAGCVSREGHEDIVLLAHASLLTSQALGALTQGHSRLYARGDGHASRQRQRGERSVYITFKLDSVMALPICGMREIIRYTDDFMRPPGLPDAVLGILNLRRRLVTIVNLRTLYGLAPREEHAAANANAKILIVEREENAYGLVVDSVENIAAVYASDKIAVPSIMMDASQKRLRADLTEVVEVPRAAGTTDDKPVVMMIFDVNKLTDRIEQVISS